KAKICEVPTAWTDRAAGKSNFKTAAWTPKYLKWYFYAFKGLFANHKKLILLLAALLAAIPAIRCFLFIQQFGVNMLWADEWELPYFFEEIRRQGLSFSALFAQHNEHRMFFPKLLSLANMYLFDYDSKIAMYCSYIFLFSGWLVLVKYIKDIKNSVFLKYISVLAVSVLCFNLRQEENLLWGFQTAWLLIFFCIIASSFLFHKFFETSKKSYLIFSLALAMIASFSLAQGLFLWFSFVFIFFLMFASREKFNRITFAVVLVSALSAFLLYFYFFGYDKGTLSTFQISFADCFAYYVRTFGSIVYTGYNFAQLSIISTVIALLSAGALIYLAVKRKIKENIFPITLMCIGHIFLFAIIIGRAKAGIIFPDSSRYVTFIQLCYIGLMLICLQNVSSNIKKGVFAAVMVILICGFEFRQIYLWQEGKFLFSDRIFRAATVKNYSKQENIQGNIAGHWWNNEQFIARIRLVEKNKWNIFSKKEAGKDYIKILRNTHILADVTVTKQKNDN
ncbi:MAG: hypothetical protein LBO62_01885, partial [Endomicrobium sp.]|nr:hypothetical protein [Endomicrobium sp.]